MGGVNVKMPQTQDPEIVTDCPKNIIYDVFIDGKSNNMIQKKDAKKLKKSPSNNEDLESEFISTEDNSLINLMPKTEKQASYITSLPCTSASVASDIW